MEMYISDTHFGHENILKECRPQFETVEEMDSLIIENINRKMKKKDVLYIVGDFSYRSKRSPISYLEKIRPKKILITGNHDRDWLKRLSDDEINRHFLGVYRQYSIKKNGIELHFGEKVTAYKGNGRVDTIETDAGTYSVDLVINAIGFRPNNLLGKDHLELFVNGAYHVDAHQQTSDPDVYAIGDCASIYSNALMKETYIALATNAVRTGIIAAHNIGGTPLEAIGVQGSNGISIFGYNMVSTGLSVKAAQKFGIDVDYADFEDLQRPAFMKENAKVQIRIVYEKTSRRIVGAQMASDEDISMGVHMFSLAIQEKVTIDKLKLLDIFFLPHFNQPYNYITMCALGAK